MTVDFRRIFVTVGTTKFQKLTDTIQTDEILLHLQRVNCETLIVQYGGVSPIPAEFIDRCRTVFGITVECYDYKPSILADITGSDLVISHAGAGSCTEILAASKPLIVVVNDDLMDNHQTELAQQLCIDGYLLYCHPATLGGTLATLSETIPRLRRYARNERNMTDLIDHLDTMMGFRWDQG